MLVKTTIPSLFSVNSKKALHSGAANCLTPSADDYYKESSGSGSCRAPSPMEKAFPRCEHNFVRKETDDHDDEHHADNLVHGI
jgi:hypothetical protein